MKLFLDENIGRSTAEALRAQGHDVSWVGGDSAGTPDTAIMAQAKREGRVLVTKDKDFGELAFKSGQAHGAKNMPSLLRRPFVLRYARL